MKNFKKTTSLLLLCLVGLTACTKKSSESSNQSSQGTLVNPAQFKPSGAVLNLAIWSSYVTQENLAEFEKRTGVRVNVSNYSSNEELLAKLQAGASGYDVIVPSDYMIFIMTKLKLLKKLDKTQVTHFPQLDPKVLKKAFDPENLVSIPFDWGTTGIAVNNTLYKGKITGWHDLFDKMGSPELKGKVTLLDDVRETIGAALKAQKLSLNSKEPKEILKAKELLMKAREDVKAFNSETRSSLINGEMSVAHAYSTDALQARKATGGKIDFIIPEEGATLWIDNLAIPVNAPHIKEAYQFIDFLLEPKVAASTVLSIFVAPSNKEVMSLLPAEYQQNTSLFPNDSTLSKLEMMQDLGDAMVNYDRTWTEVKAGGQ